MFNKVVLKKNKENKFLIRLPSVQYNLVTCFFFFFLSYTKNTNGTTAKEVSFECSESSEFLVNVILKGYQNKINYSPNHACSMYS